MHFSRLSLILTVVILALFSATPSFAARPPLAIYLTVFKANENTFWAQKACQKIYNLIQNTDELEAHTRPEVHCDWHQDETFLSEKTKLVRRSGYFQYMLELKETDQEYRLRWVNWSPIDNVDFTQVSWAVKKQGSPDLYLRKLLNGLLAQHRYRLALRRHFVTKALQTLQKSPLNHPLSEGEIDQFINADPKNRHYVKTALETMATFGIGVSDQIKSYEFARVAWDTDTMATMWGEKSKFKTPINWSRLNSEFEIPLLCQSDSMKGLDLSLCSDIASLAWEMILEYRQIISLRKVSLPTEISSVLSGTLTHLQQIMTESGNSVARKNLKEIFKSPQEIENIFPTKGTPVPFRISSQVTERKNTSIEIPLLETPKGTKKLITTMDFRQRFNEEMLMQPYRDFTSTMQIAIAAYYEKNKNPTNQAPPLQGYNFFIGPKKAVDNRTIVNKSTNPKNTDFIGSVHVFGSTLRLVTYSRGWRIQAILDVYADFASVRSYALDRYEFAEGDPMGVPQPSKHDYYYGVGTTSLAQVIVEYGNWSIDISAQDQVISNMNNYRPEPFLVENRADHFTGLELGTQYRLAQGLFLRLAINETQRSGHIEDIGTRSSITQTIIASLIYRF